MLKQSLPKLFAVNSAPSLLTTERACLLQFEAIKGYLKSGGSAAFLLGEGGEERLGTNVNYLLEEYGMTVHKDSVVSKQPRFGGKLTAFIL